MKKLLFIFLSCFALMACEDPTKPYGYDKPKPTASFTFTQTQPMTVVLKNKSSSYDRCIWDMGDGHTVDQTDCTYRYNKKGVYKITLTVYTMLGLTDSYSQTVTILEPSSVYLKGVTYHKVPKQNEYYKISVTDDDIFTTTWVHTNWTLLSTANCPYLYTFSSLVLMNGLSEDNYYNLNVFYNTKSSGDGTRCARFNIPTSKILTYPESISGEADGCKVELHFAYK